MVVFRVTENINIKTTDGTLVKYEKLKGPSNLLNETIYITTLEDFNDLKKVFESVESKYKAKVIDESKLRYLSQFPTELGISNINEYNITNNLNYKYKDNIVLQKENNLLESMYLEEQKVDLKRQISQILKKDVKVLILGSLGTTISEMICACTALRIFYEKLSKQFKSVKLDIYLNASENRFYSRDKMIFSNQAFVNRVSALSIDVKEFCSYDFFVDASSISKRSFYNNLNHIDAWLYKIGIDYEKITQEKKYNQIDLSKFKPRKELKEKLLKIKENSKILLFHPFSANIEKSIPKEYALKLLKKLIEKMPDYTFISTIKIDAKFSDNNYFDLSNESSKSFLDYCYIVSCASKVLTVNTSSYHIADAFFIPKLVILNSGEVEEEQKLVIYPQSKFIFVEDKTKNYSQFIFKNESLLLNRFEGWEKLKAKRVISLLDKL